MKAVIALFLFAAIIIQIVDSRPTKSEEIAETRGMALKDANHIPSLKDMKYDVEEEDDENAVAVPSNHPISTKSQMKQQRLKELNKKFLFLLPFL
uniref:Uncharacterized protein n=1 Tax=Panagrolaimus davidi TaxID=227884 RepID=A0A914P3X1_9BILA